MLLLLLAILIATFIIITNVAKSKKIRYPTTTIISFMKPIIFIMGFLTVVAITFFSTFIATEYICYKELQICENENLEILAGLEQSLTFYDKNSNVKLNKIEDRKEIIYSIISIPELANNDFIKEKIKTYSDNKNKIKDLKIRINNMSIYKWLLYFGR